VELIGFKNIIEAQNFALDNTSGIVEMGKKLLAPQNWKRLKMIGFTICAELIKILETILLTGRRKMCEFC